jgi:transposase
LLFEALVMTLAREMPLLVAATRLVQLFWHRVAAICKRYVGEALDQADFSEVRRLAADEISRARGQEYIILAAEPMGALRHRRARSGYDRSLHRRPFGSWGDPQAISSISIEISPAFIKGITAHLPKATITFDKFHV